MNIAIVGAGLAGLSVAWHLLRHKNTSVTLFDQGGGASVASTGLLHPFPAKNAKRSWRAEEGMQASYALIAEAEKALGRPVADRRGILRLIPDGIQDPDAIEQEKGVFHIPRGLAVYSQTYLSGLLLAIQAKGAQLQHTSIQDLQELDAFDTIILAAGAGMPQFGQWPLKKTKGQALLCRVKEAPPMALFGGGHISPTEDPTIWQVGSTYERDFTTDGPDEAAALPLLDKVAQFYPPARDFEVLEVRAGVRISPQYGYRPFMGQVGPKTWVFTGLGSRGLLYHALLGKELVDSLLLN